MGIEKLSPAAGVSAALFGETRRRVLGLLLGHPDERYYQNRIIDTLRIGSGAVQRELQRLTGAGILRRSVEGRQVYFQADPACPIFEELRAIARKTFGVVDVLAQALGAMRDSIRVAFVFGSVATGEESAGSDLDLVVIGDKTPLISVVSSLRDAQRELNREINPIVYSAREFSRKLADGHHFVSSLLTREKIFIAGDDRDLAAVAQVRVGQGASHDRARTHRSVRRGRS